jgi:hypothetical protein
VGLHEDGSFYQACLVLDIPTISKTKDELYVYENKTFAEIIALSSININDLNSKPKVPFLGRKDFSKTFLSIAINFSKQLGCTHVLLTDAANIRISDKSSQLLSTKIMITTGKTFYEKYGFHPLKPFDQKIRDLHNLQLKDLSDENQTEIKKLLGDINSESTIKKIFTRKDSEKTLKATEVLFSHLPKSLMSEKKENFYDFVREYTLDLSQPPTFEYNCVVEQFYSLDLKEDQSKWPKDFNIKILEGMKSYKDLKLDVKE